MIERQSPIPVDPAGQQFADKCTNCGLCLEVCHVFPLTRFAHLGPQVVMEKVNRLLKGQELSEEAYDMAYACSAGCGRVCAAACPERLAPGRAFGTAKVTMAAAGMSAPPVACQWEPGSRLNAAKVLPAIQIMPAEVRWLNGVPASPQPVDVVFFAGCGASTFPNLFLDTVDILERMKLNFVALAGGDLCCGAGQGLVGKTGASGPACQGLVSAISAFQPKQAVFFCHGCSGNITRRIPELGPVSFERVWLPQFLLDNLSRIPFDRSVHGTVALHDSCSLNSIPDGFEIPRRLLRAIPGLTLVEMEHNRQNARCCGGASSLPRSAFTKGPLRATIAEAEAVGAGTLATVCAGCHRGLGLMERDFHVQVRSYVSLVAEALGVRHEDRYQKYAGYRDLERVLAESREGVEAAGYTVAEMTRILPDYLPS